MALGPRRGSNYNAGISSRLSRGASAIARASRILTILLGIGVTVFLLGPAAIPLGFDGVWWASQQAQSRPEPPPAKPEPPQPAIAPSPPQAEAPPPPPQPASAQQPAAPDAGSPQAGASGERTAALNGADHAAAPAPPTVTKLYYRVTVRDGGTMQSDGVTIKLAGIAARSADATCKGKAGKS